MSLKNYLLILKGGIYLSFITIFFVFNNLFFPFITSKQIPFNILIEILFIFWLGLIISYPEIRPKKSLSSFSLIAFFIIIVLSGIFGVDFNLSFWGDSERMLGAFSVLHFFIFYFIIITVFRSSNDWRNLLLVSISIASLVCLYGLIKNIAYSTLGNTAYLSGYAIFNIFFSLILFFKYYKSLKKDEKWLSYLLLIFPILILSVFKMTNTRGAYVGLAIGIFITFILFIIFIKNKKFKTISIIFLIIFISFVSSIFIFSGSAFIKNISIFNTINQITPKAITFQTRLISWKAAIKDFPNHPILGTGYGNFAITFDKYFDPTFYNFTKSETYFDRAHNNLVDILSTTGILGLVAYLSIIFSAIYYLIKGFKKGKINQYDFILLIGLITAYLVQNLVIFDSFVTYFSLMIMLGYIYKLDREEDDDINNINVKLLNNKQISLLILSCVLIFYSIYQFNYKPLKMLSSTVKANFLIDDGNFSEGVKEFKKAFNYNTVLDRKSRDLFIRKTSYSQSYLDKINKDKVNEILNYGISIAERNVSYNKNDSLMLLNLANIYSLITKYNNDNKEKLEFYSAKALEAIDKSINSSPGRISLYYTKAQILASQGEKEKTFETLNYALNLNTQYYESYCQLAKYYFYFKEEAIGFDNMNKCIDNGSSNILSPIEYVVSLLNYYIQKKDWPRAIKIYNRLIELDPKNPKFYTGLAAVYDKNNEYIKAIEAARTAVSLDPALNNATEEFIKSVEKKIK